MHGATQRGRICRGIISLLALLWPLWATAAVSGITLAANPPAPAPPKTTVTLTAAATGGTNVVYEFWLGTQLADASWDWAIYRAYATTPTCTWTPTVSGEYIIEAWARDGGSTAKYDASDAIAYRVSDAQPLTGLTLTVAPTMPQPVGTALTATATPTGGTQVEYEFWLGTQALDSNWTWSIYRPYATDPTCTWTPTASGTYAIEVWARNTGDTADSAVTDARPCIITPATALNRVALVTAPPSPQNVGSAITLTAVPAGGKKLEFQFWISYPDANGVAQWSVLRPYAASPTCTWTPQAANSYDIEVWAREVGSTRSYDVNDWFVFNVGLTTQTDPAQVRLLPQVAVPQPTGTAISLLASADGDNAQYRFVVGQLRGRTWTWTVLRDYATAPTCTWTPNAAGHYRLVVWARRAGSTISSQVYAAVPFTIIDDLPQTSRVSVAKFWDDKAGAVSFTLDDGTQNQSTLALPIFDAAGVKATFFVITDDTRDLTADPLNGRMSWEELAKMSSEGHEIGNHSETHVTLPDLTPAALVPQVVGAAATIAAKVGVTPCSYALPNSLASETVYEYILQSHAAIRFGGMEYGGDGFTVARANDYVDRAIQARDWAIPIIHGMEQDYTPLDHTILQAHLAYLTPKCDRDLWIDTFGNISRYTIERENTTLAISTETATSVVCTLQTAIDTAYYSRPLTLIVGPFTTAPKAVQAHRAGAAGETTLPCKVVPTHDTPAAYEILVDVVPGEDPVLINWQ